MKLTKDQVLGALVDFDHEALKAIRAAADGLIRQGGSQPPDGQQNACTWLFEAMQGIISDDPRLQAAKPDKRAYGFIGFAQKHFPETMAKKVTAIAVMRSLLNLIAEDLKDKQVPVTFGTLMNNLPRIPEVYEVAFPGYLSSGLAQLFIKPTQR